MKANQNNIEDDFKNVIVTPKVSPTFDENVEFGRSLEVDSGVFSNFARLESMAYGRKRIIADFEQFECKNIQVNEESTKEDDFNDWVDIQKESPETKASRLKEERLFLQKFASGEFLAHWLAYKPLGSCKTIKVLEAVGTYREHTVQKLQTTHDGLVGYVLIPTTALTDSVLDLKVIFQGTKSLAGVSRDIWERGGAGTKTFEKNKDNILSQINTIVAQYQKPTNIVLAGHSLGASDAQNCMGALMEAFAQNRGVNVADDEIIPGSSRTDLDKVQKLQLFGYNSAGITHERNEKAKELAKIFHEKKLPIALECNYLRMHKDGVQQTGETSLLNGVLSEHAKVEVMKATSLEQYSAVDLAKRVAIVAASATLGAAILAPVAISAGLAAGLSLAATSVGIINTNDAHKQHLFKEKKASVRFSYERLSNQNPSEAHQVNVKKSSVLNAVHKSLLTVLNPVKQFHSSLSQPVIFSSSSTQVKEEKIESQKTKKRWWGLF